MSTCQLLDTADMSLQLLQTVGMQEAGMWLSVAQSDLFSGLVSIPCTGAGL